MISGIPTPYTLAWKQRFDTGVVDGHGNTVWRYEDPVDWPVHGYSPGPNEIGTASTSASTSPNRDPDTIRWTVYAPAGPAPAAYDLVTIDGTDYLVSGDDSDWVNGPWAFADAGVTVALTDTKG